VNVKFVPVSDVALAMNVIVWPTKAVIGLIAKLEVVIVAELAGNSGAFSGRDSSEMKGARREKDETRISAATITQRGFERR